MPYRRLPKTDKTRLRALQQAVQHANEADYNDQPICYQTLSAAQRLLLQFENQVQQYHTSVDSKVSANKQYRHRVTYARMYISHFIQVLNMSVMRGEIKRQQKALYKLDPDSYTLPDLSTEDSLMEWGQNIIEGERQRTAQGGYPIYNPNINKVQVFYDMFKENYESHNLHKKAHLRVYEDIENIRKDVDTTLLDIWNQVESHYREELPYARLQKCKAYGLIYYYRKGEKKLTAQSDMDLAKKRSMQTTLQWSE